MDNKKFDNYKDSIDIIDECLSKQKWKWNETSVKWKQWEDVEQDIKLHIYIKWPTYDKTKGPLKPWITRIISNRIFNIKRDIWGKYAKPCSTCKAALPYGMCSLFTYQSDECLQYKKWQVKKESAYNMNNAISIDGVLKGEESSYKTKDEFHLILKEIEEELELILTEKERLFYELFFVQEKSEEYIVDYMSLQKPSDGSRNKTIKNLEKSIRKKIVDIIHEQV